MCIRQFTSVVAIFSLAVVTISASGATQPPHRGQPVRKDVQAAIDANISFAVDLYAQLKDEHGNLFFSPLSVSTALAIAEAGARGNTQIQLHKGLHLEGLNPNTVPAAMAELIGDLTPKPGSVPYQLTIANALWPQAGYRLNGNYVHLIKTSYGGSVTPLDFGDPATAAQTINEWVAQRTHDRIKDLISPTALNGATRLVLTDAVYFKGTWEWRFPENATRDEPFTTDSGAKVQVPMMHESAHFAYGETPSVQVLKMGYNGGDLEMVVLLPVEGTPLAMVEKNLVGGHPRQWMPKLESHEVIVSLPRFRMTYFVGLNPMLKGLGVTDAFDPDKANFLGITSQEHLFISDVIHKAFVEVNEKGTEAAAATAVVVGAGSATPPTGPVPFVFRADHPFVFVIQDTKTGLVLFMGRVMNPKE